MTLCNMSIEAGARAAMVAPDETTFAYLKGRRFAPQGADWEKAVAYWRTLGLRSAGAKFDKMLAIDARTLAPFVTWGTNPGMVVQVTGRVPEMNGSQRFRPARDRASAAIHGAAARALESKRLQSIACSSAPAPTREWKILRAAARVAKGYRVNAKVRAMVVPGSQAVKHAAEQEGLHRIFQEAGFEWRESGCSMCLGMNPDILQPGERCASTSNRNFEGRQGRGGRTHLVSPMMAAAAAIAGHFTDIRKWKFQ